MCAPEGPACESALFSSSWWLPAMLSRSLSVPCSHVDTGLVYTPSLDLTVLTLNVVTCIAAHASALSLLHCCQSTEYAAQSHHQLPERCCQYCCSKGVSHAA